MTESSKQRPGQPPRHFVTAPQRGPKPIGLPVAALVLGLVGLVFSVIPWCTWLLAIPCNILGIIFGAVGVANVKRGEGAGAGMAKAGLICGIIGLAVMAVWIVMFLNGMIDWMNLQFDDFGHEGDEIAALLTL